MVPKPHIWNRNVGVISLETQTTGQSTGLEKDCNFTYFNFARCRGRPYT